MKLSHLQHRRPAKAQASLRICAVSPEPSLFAHIKYRSRQRVRPKIRHLAYWMAAHVRLKNEFKEDEKYHNFMRWLNYPFLQLIMLLTSTSKTTQPYIVHMDISSHTSRMKQDITSNHTNCRNLRQIQHFQRQSNVFIYARSHASCEMENDITNVYKRPGIHAGLNQEVSRKIWLAYISPGNLIWH